MLITQPTLRNREILLLLKLIPKLLPQSPLVPGYALGLYETSVERSIGPKWEGQSDMDVYVDNLLEFQFTPPETKLETLPPSLLI